MSLVYTLCKQTLVCSQRCRALEEKRKIFAFGKVDQPLKAKIYFKGFAANDCFLKENSTVGLNIKTRCSEEGWHCVLLAGSAD